MHRHDALRLAERAWADGQTHLTRQRPDAAARAFRTGYAHACRAGAAGTPAARPSAVDLAARCSVGLGRALLRQADHGGAVRHFLRAQGLAPHAWWPSYWLGCAAAHRGAYRAAEAHLTTAADGAPDDGRERALRQRAYVRLRLGDWEGARADLRAVAAARRDGHVDDRWALAALSGVTGRRLSRLLRAAALTAVAAPPGTVPDWPRAAALTAAALRLAPGPRDDTPLHAAVLARGGRRREAARLLTEAVRHTSTDQRLNHLLGLVLLGTLTHAPDGDGPAWAACLAAWGAVLHDPVFWDTWRRDAARRYRAPIPPETLRAVRADLVDYLERHLPAEAGGARVPPSVLLAREVTAARLLAQAGGLPLDGDRGHRATLVCGPLRVRELGEERRLGAWIAAGQPPPELTDALLVAFSRLGVAQELARRRRDSDALALLADLRCGRCRRGPVDPARGPAVCGADCARFDALNPAFAGWPDGRRRLTRHARELALPWTLDAARHVLATDRPAMGDVAELWRRAIVHGRALDRYGPVQGEIVDMALSEARRWHRARELTGAITVLETAYAVVGANERRRLAGQLARTLTDRAVLALNQGAPALERPTRDLRRALALNPHLRRARVGLVAALCALSVQRWRSGSRSGAVAAAREACDLADEALLVFPDDPRLVWWRRQAVAGHQAMTGHSGGR